MVKVSPIALNKLPYIVMKWSASFANALLSDEAVVVTLPSSVVNSSRLLGPIFDFVVYVSDC